MIDDKETRHNTSHPNSQAPQSDSPNVGGESTKGIEARQEPHDDSNAADNNAGPPNTSFWKGTLAEWVTVFFTAVIAVVAVLQLRVYRQQKEIMSSQGELQVQVARLNYGAPFVTLTRWMGVYNRNGQVYATVNIFNQGRTSASSIQGAIRMDFGDTIPTDYSFRDFQSADPSTLPAFEPQSVPYDPNVINPTQKVAEHATFRVPIANPLVQGVNYANKKIYVWGRIRFKDFTGEWAPDSTICRFTSDDDMVQFSKTGVALVSSDCSKKTANQ